MLAENQLDWNLADFAERPAKYLPSHLLLFMISIYGPPTCFQHHSDKPASRKLHTIKQSLPLPP